VSTQARPQDYARAIYELALETWTRQLNDVQHALEGDPALRTEMKDDKILVQDRLKRLDSTTQAGLSESVGKFLGTLITAGQIDQLAGILVEFERLVRRRVERKLARVTSAVPLTIAEQEAFRVRLAEQFGHDLEFQFAVEPALIGGIHLRVGDQVIDGSVAGKLAALRDRLAA
jgi:F-type H+-transporting ATPase subunit delta